MSNKKRPNSGQLSQDFSMREESVSFPLELAEILEQQAKIRGVSFNEYVIEALMRSEIPDSVAAQIKTNYQLAVGQPANNNELEENIVNRTGVKARRSPRLNDKYEKSVISLPTSLAEKFQDKADEQGVSFSFFMLGRILDNLDTSVEFLSDNNIAPNAGQRAKRAPRTREKSVKKGLCLPAQLFKGLKQNAASQGISFSRYVLEICSESATGEETEKVLNLNDTSADLN